MPLQGAAVWSKSTSGKIKDGGRRQNQNWKWLNRNNSTVEYPILLKFGQWVLEPEAGL